MGPITTNPSTLVSPLNPTDPSSGATLAASDIVQQMMEKLSSEFLGINGKISTVWSPASTAQVLGMVLLSIEDNTKKELALGIPPGSLTKELEAQIHQKIGEFGKQCNLDEAFSTTNFIATADHLSNEQFERTLSECYETEKLRPDNRYLVDVVESFVKDKTNGEIEKLFDGLGEDKRKQMTAAIGNVMKLQGAWKKDFSRDKTGPDEFLDASGKIQNVEMMSATDEFYHAITTEFEAIAKEFKSVHQEDLKLVAIKPLKRSPTAINKLDTDSINHLISSLNGCKRDFELKLPKIEVVESCDSELLKKISLALGTTIEAEDLSRLGNNLCSSHLTMVQKIKTSINEKGADAAIATAAATTARGGLLPFYLDDDEEYIDYFHFDCPGYIGIVDSKGNRLLELIIKDASFLVPADSPVVTDPEGVEDDDLSDDDETDQNVRGRFTETHPQANKIDKDVPKTEFSPAKNEQLQQDGKSSIEDTITSTLEKLAADPLSNIDVNTLIQHVFNPTGKLSITSAMATRDFALAIKVTSSDDADEIKTGVLKLIGEEYENSVKILSDPKSHIVVAYFEASKKLFENLTSRFK